MTEAARAVIDWYFGTEREAVRIRSGVFHFNQASLAVQKKLGFTETGSSRRHCLARGEDVRHIDTELSRADWAGARPGATT
jgi:RimJ/RimL family protein N-acetyltransferase